MDIMGRDKPSADHRKTFRRFKNVIFSFFRSLRIQRAQNHQNISQLNQLWRTNILKIVLLECQNVLILDGANLDMIRLFSDLLAGTYPILAREKLDPCSIIKHAEGMCHLTYPRTCARKLFQRFFYITVCVREYDKKSCSSAALTRLIS